MKTYLINLDRSPERLEFMRSQLAALDVRFQRIAAVDGRSLNADAYPTSRIRPSELGCYLSHMTAWRMLCEGTDEFAMVLEDDVRLSTSLALITRSTDWIPDDVDLVKLETSTRRIAIGRQGHPAPGERTVHRLLKRDICTGGYIIRRRLAEQFIRESDFSLPVDVFMFDKLSVQKNRIFQMNPAVVIQEHYLDSNIDGGLKSTIHSERSARHSGERSNHQALKQLNRMFLRPIESVWKSVRRVLRSHKVRELKVEFR
ncbi:glycosyltransferase family 25 protein [Nitratireductor aquimarinus]|uniref:glycosyltransferase family 25 protein n=1 Tax=Nitratireductor TaxID=245876 RepID=UPI0019D35569|nr:MULTISPECIES: glycosyltransferase family 25 protein [Nitratireductor]MBN7778899.1 glycosyltransferase family 25 protein [Nitratireductor pacificus]MBN7783236.1 glycosyltransferase family 25 protein [Nitratireductor pacificus]MBN7792037.1 glycosyltransferase family 25 protein [Nitratireductor aquimarinus]MBY6101284.1 glycosyltransferase family 25 protein [Nitratireductor aquimarinus]MCA1262571.1 glycosyltransferase family 25 protein [Nitratireductor aquimarinus]